MNEFNPDGKDIRFIDSHYRDLFRIPDGGTIQVHYSDDSVVIKPCKFIDEYHTQIGNNVFHICQFAELLERNGSYCQAEPEIMGDEAAWQVGRDQYLAIQTCEDGYDYTLFDKEFHEIDGGQLDNPELSIIAYVTISMFKIGFSQKGWTFSPRVVPDFFQARLFLFWINSDVGGFADDRNTSTLTQ